MKKQGLSIQAISQELSLDRKTVRKYLAAPAKVPGYGPRAKGGSQLDPHKEYLADRMKAGVWNARVLLRELRTQGYAGGYTILTDWLRPQRQSARVVAVRRFETPPGRRKPPVVGLRDHAGLQPGDVRRRSHRPKTGHAAAEARAGVSRVGWRAGRDPLRPHEDGLARHR